MIAAGKVDILAVLYKDKRGQEHRQVALVAGDRAWLFPEDMREIKIFRAPTYLEEQVVVEAADLYKGGSAQPKKGAVSGRKKTARSRPSTVGEL